MGAWGEDPIENDMAADLANDLKSCTVYEIVEKGLASQNGCEQRFAAWLLIRLGEPLVYDNEIIESHVILALEKMRALLTDGWIDSWKDESMIRKSVQKQIDDLSKLYGNVQE